jgi:Rod binding domain-containing protein
MTGIPPVSLPVMPPPATAGEGAAATAQAFEAMFLTQTVDEMLKTVPLMGGGHGEEMWRSFLARAIAEEISGGAGAGIAQSVETAIAGYGRAAGGGE